MSRQRHPKEWVWLKYLDRMIQCLHMLVTCYNILEPLLEDDINNQEVDLQLMIYNVYILYMFKGG